MEQIYQYSELYQKQLGTTNCIILSKRVHNLIAKILFKMLRDTDIKTNDFRILRRGFPHNQKSVKTTQVWKPCDVSGVVRAHLNRGSSCSGTKCFSFAE